MKIWNMSRVSACASRLMMALIASSTTELITMGRRPSRSAVSLTCRIASLTLSSESTKGIVTRRNEQSSNCVSRLLPSISAVMPVRSDKKKTVRWSDIGLLHVGDVRKVARDAHRNIKRQCNHQGRQQIGRPGYMKRALGSERKGEHMGE